MPTSLLLRSVAYRTAALTCALFFASGVLLAALGPSLPSLARQVGVEVAALGGLFTAFSAGVILAQAGVVWASHRYSQRATLAASATLVAGGGLAITLSTVLVLVFVAALLAGFGFGGVLATGNTLVARLFAERSAAALNAVNVFFGVGSIVGPVLAALANTSAGLPQLALWVGAAVLLLLVPLIRYTAPASQPELASRPAERARLAPQTWLLGLMLLCYMGSEIGLAAWLTVYMVHSTGLETGSAALAVSLFWLALTSGRALAAASGGRLGAPRLLGACLLGLLLGAGVLAVGVGQVVPTLVGVALFGLSCGPVFPTVLALVSTDRASALATGTVLVLGNGGGLIVPAMIGLLLTRYGAGAVTSLLLVTALLMLALGALVIHPSITRATR